MLECSILLFGKGVASLVTACTKRVWVGGTGSQQTMALVMAPATRSFVLCILFFLLGEISFFFCRPDSTPGFFHAQ